MRAGFAALVLAYVLSQFYRAMLAVLAPALGAEIGATAGDLALASGLWFAVFAAMQVPVGIGLDRIGPRRTAAGLFLVGGGGGAALFAVAQSPAAVVAAMCLIGLGCAPVLMASFYIFARRFSPAVFASLAGVLIGVGSAGNLASAAPMAWAVEAFGWRATMWGLAAVTVAVALALYAFVADPPHENGDGAEGARLLDILRMPALWVMAPLLVINYAPAAGIRGLWAGPYLADVFGLDAAGIGIVTLWMAGAMILGNFAYGPLDRWLGTRKWVLVAGNAAGAAALIGLGLFPSHGVIAAAALLAAVGFFGASFPLMIAHARSYFPAHLLGRGVTLANLMSIGGVGLMQIASGRLHGGMIAAGAGPEAAYGALFLFFGLLLAGAVAIYLLAEDRLD
jgi:predicted MFS family arabinose efflux permease